MLVLELAVTDTVQAEKLTAIYFVMIVPTLESAVTDTVLLDIWMLLS